MITIVIWIYLDYPTLHAICLPIVGLSVTCETHIVDTSSVSETNLFWVSSIFHFLPFEAVYGENTP